MTTHVRSYVILQLPQL